MQLGVYGSAKGKALSMTVLVCSDRGVCPNHGPNLIYPEGPRILVRRTPANEDYTSEKLAQGVWTTSSGPGPKTALGTVEARDCDYASSC